MKVSMKISFVTLIMTLLGLFLLNAVAGAVEGPGFDTEIVQQK